MTPKRLLALVLLAAIAATAILLFNQDPALVPLDPGSSGAATGRPAAADTQQGKLPAERTGENRQVVAGGSGAANPASAAHNTRPAALRGRLVTAAGAPQAAALEFRPVPAGPARLALPPELAGQLAADPVPGEAGADGRFELQVPAGAGILRIRGEAMVLAEAGPGAGLEVEVAAAGTDLGDLRVVPAAVVSGQVVAGGMAVAGVEIAVHRDAASVIGFGAGQRTVQTDAEGRFRIGGLVPGAFRLDTRSPDYLPAQQKFEVAAGEQKSDLLIRLRQGAVITGTVVDDLGQPVEGVAVTAARSRKLSPGIEYSGFTPGESAQTDASGQFRLAGLAEAAVEIRAYKKGFAPGRVAMAAAGTANLVIAVERLGRITGVLVDEKGQPIAGSEVRARLPQAGLGYLPSVHAETGATGAFVLDGVAPGENSVTAAGDGHLEVAQRVTVRPGDTTEGVRLVARRGATLTVTVLDDQRRPVPNAEVVVKPAGQSDQAIFHAAGPGAGRATRREVRRERRGGRTVRSVVGGDEPLGSAETDADGVAVVRGLAAGVVQVRASHAELALLEAGRVEVPEAGDVATQLQMVRGGFAKVHVVDHAGKDLPKAPLVIIGPLTAGSDEPPRNRHEVDGAGRLRVGPLAPGRYQAALEEGARPRSIGSGMSFSLLGDQSELADSKVAFAVAAEKETDVEVVMPVLTTVTGTVRDAQGVVAGAEVELLAEGQIRLPMMGKYKTNTDAEGRFEIPGLPAGKYTISFNRKGALVPAEQPVSLARNQPTHQADLTLPGAVVRLRVKDATEGFGVEDARIALRKYTPPSPDGAPAPRRQVVMIGMSTTAGGRGPSTFRMSGGAAEIRTDGKGVAEIPGVPAGKYTLTVEHADYAKVTKVVQVVGDQLKDLGELPVTAGCKLRGTVEFPPRAAMSMCTVEVRGADGSRETTFSQDGTFRFTGLPAGSYKVRAQAISSAAWGPEQTVTLDPKRAARVALTLPKDG